jgi:O-antigen/teichoic acid export membrane protein
MLAHYGMNTANGIYTMAYRAINIATMPIRSIQSAAFPRFCVLGAGGVCETIRYAWKVLRRTSAIGIVMAACLWIMAPLIPYLVGSSFSESVSAIRWLCLLPLFRAFHLSAGDAMAGAGFQSHRLGVQLFSAIANFSCNLWLIPHYGWLGAAWASIVTDGTLGAMNWGMLLYLVHDSARVRQLDSATLVEEVRAPPTASTTFE